MDASQEVLVRDLRVEDRTRVAQILVESFPEKMYAVRGVTEETAPHLVIESGPPFAAPFSGNLVAELDGRVVGAMALKWRGQTLPPRRELHPLSGRTGWWVRNKVRLAQRIIDERPRPGHCYVAHISVAPEARGKGAGTALLQRGEEIGRERGLGTFSLYVAGTNVGAIRVYRRFGFSRSWVLRSRTTGWLLGISEWWFMEKALRP